MRRELSRSVAFRAGGLAAALLLVALAGPAGAVTWRVPSQCPTIHAGLDSASYGDTVLVASGTYLETDEPSTWVAMSSGERLMSEDGAEATIIEFCNSSTGIGLNQCENVLVSGFTIRFGSGPGCEPPMGTTRGISCWMSTDVVVENCIMEQVGVGISASGRSSQWWKPMFRNNVIRNCGYGVLVDNMVDPGRPAFVDNVITECHRGVYVENSMPEFDGNQMTYCADWGMYYLGNCGGGCMRSVIAHNGGGVYICANPPYAAPCFNGGLSIPDANDFYDNTSYDLSYECCRQGEDPYPVFAPLNYWGSRCPDSAAIFRGPVVYVPWVDSTHTQLLNRNDCPDATVPATWGAIKAMFR